ncbi:MAG: GAF domain-containing protein [Deltaproteobacteria bacterium]|jgi:putative methionine-R-sulfoxide reductase with GAF domain
MVSDRQDHTARSGDHQVDIESLLEITHQEYTHVSPLLENLCADVVALYRGDWPTHEACQVGYHTIEHAADVALASARMTAGWNKVNPERKIPEDYFLAGMAAAFFHDAGYLKDKGDQDGQGGKFTFRHVERSSEMARLYLAARNWPSLLVELAPKIISVTEFQDEPRLAGQFHESAAETIARMVATADLVAQMADVDYMQSIRELFEEFQEAYKFEGRENLQKQGIHVFGSLQEVLDGTISFYENFVLPRLQQLGRMDQYLIAFFGEGRNPYLENIAANLSGQLLGKRVQWRRLGDILQELGVATSQQIEEALARQQAQKSMQPAEQSAPPFHRWLLVWMESQDGCRCLGDILMEMKIIEPKVLREGLLTQLLPGATLEGLSREEMFALLRISLLLPNIYKGQWIMGQIQEMINGMLVCEAGSILLANPDRQEMVVMAQAGPRRHREGRTLPLDKGLAGWVYRHGQPVTLADALGDERYNGELDQRIDLEIESILAVPIYMNGECVGVMEAFNKRSGNFDEHDLEVLTMLANVIATTLDCVLKPPQE